MGDEARQQPFWESAGVWGAFVVHRQPGTVFQPGHFGLASLGCAHVPKSQRSLFYELLTKSQLLAFPSLSTCFTPRLLQPAGGGGVNANNPGCQQSAFQPTSSQARASSSCYSFPREPGSCLFWHVVRELVELHHANPNLNQRSDFLDAIKLDWRND